MPDANAAPCRLLLTVADDFGIGPETSRAIVELASAGVVTATVLLANSPYAAESVERWRKAGRPGDLGWHPCLTMDPPVAPPADVPSLLGPDGNLLPLREFLPRLAAGLIRADHVARELRAQYGRFRELAGEAPRLVNAHQHVALFPPVGRILREVLREESRRPYLRRVREPWTMLARVRGARVKRAFLNLMGRREAAGQARDGFPGADWLIGVTDPPWVRDPCFWARWLAAAPGEVVELMCHPGHLDRTLVGRDCGEGDGLMQRRVDERLLLADPAFLAACRRAGFTLAAPSHLLQETKARSYVA